MHFGGARQSIPRAALVAGLAAVVIAGVGAVRTRAQTTAAGAPTSEGFGADLTVRYGYLDSAGQAVRTPPPAVTLHVERARQRGGWRTTMTLQGMDRPLVRAGDTTRELDNPFLVSRIEYDEDGTPPRLFNRHGVLLQAPDERAWKRLRLPPGVDAPDPAAEMLREARQMSGPADQASGLVTTIGAQTRRRDVLARQFGPSVGQMHGLEVYRTDTAGESHELLVDPGTALPVEVNTTRGAALIAHATFTHEALPGGVLVRRHIHAERLLEDGSGQRMMTDLEVANVRVGAGRPQ
jgi:hypothetical protein